MISSYKGRPRRPAASNSTSTSELAGAEKTKVCSCCSSLDCSSCSPSSAASSKAGPSDVALHARAWHWPPKLTWNTQACSAGSPSGCIVRFSPGSQSKVPSARRITSFQRASSACEMAAGTLAAPLHNGNVPGDVASSRPFAGSHPPSCCASPTTRSTSPTVVLPQSASHTRSRPWTDDSLSSEKLLESSLLLFRSLWPCCRPEHSVEASTSAHSPTVKSLFGPCSHSTEPSGFKMTNLYSTSRSSLGCPKSSVVAHHKG
mmetsp:Transcript_171120/g.548425  ORF Transcript_171120/g.548425 Transcript_171120/m.548425 type:complete len:260 (+) Transcript_171120:1376-2155(+)